MDPFEDFEFKPLTEGLGFHKKAEKIKADIKSTDLTASLNLDSEPKARTGRISSDAVADLLGRNETPRPASQSISDLIASLPPSLDFLDDKPEAAEPIVPKRPSRISETVAKAATRTEAPPKAERPQIFQPLVHEDFKTGPTIGSVLPQEKKTARSAALNTPGTAAPLSAKAPASAYREQLEESFARAFPQTERTAKKATQTTAAGLTPVAVHFGAAILDAMVISGLTTVLLVCILAITRVNLMGLLTNAQTDVATRLNLLLLFVAVLQMYMLTARSFAGASLGEWAFDLQLGDDEDQRKTVYPLLVAWRTLIVTITGIALLPILSFMFGKDLTRKLTGLQLYRRP